VEANPSKIKKAVKHFRKDEKGGFLDPMNPRFKMGQQVFYFVEELGNEKWHTAKVIGIAYPGEDGHPYESGQIRYRLLPDKEAGQVYEIETRKENELRDWSWTRPCLVTINNHKTGLSHSKPTPLVPLNLVGIDTCSALSVSSRKEDFLWIDYTKEARKSVILRGVGGDSARIGGRGPMVVAGLDKEGNEILIFDPSAVYLDTDSHQADFRIFGQQRLKNFGFNLQQRNSCDGGDILCYNDGQRTIPLITNAGILALKTHKRKLTAEQMKTIEDRIDAVLQGEDGLEHCIQISSSLLMNEANLTKIEQERLMHWRIGHRSIAKSKLNENCPICAEGKSKTGTFKRNYEFCGSTRGESDHYFRLYVDGYGGLRSMGDMSYQGGHWRFCLRVPKRIGQNKIIWVDGAISFHFIPSPSGN
jgi:hypothetical protein